MAGTVTHKSDQMIAVTFRSSEHTVCNADDGPDDIDVTPLVKAADIVGLPCSSLVIDKIDSPRMVLDLKPVSDIKSLAVDRQRLLMAYVIYHQGNQLLRELIWAIVVRAICDHDRHAVCVMISSDKMVARCL